MAMSDPIAYMLTRIRNACSAGHKRVDMPASKLKNELARLLRDIIADPELRRLQDTESSWQFANQR